MGKEGIKKELRTKHGGKSLSGCKALSAGGLMAWPSPAEGQGLAELPHQA